MNYFPAFFDLKGRPALIVALLPDAVPSKLWPW